MLHKSTEELTNELKAATNVRDYLSKNKENLLDESLPEHLEKLLTQKKLKKSDVIRGSLLGKAYVYKIFDGEKSPQEINYSRSLSGSVFPTRKHRKC